MNESLGIRVRPGTVADAAGMAALISGIIAEGKPILLSGQFSEEAERAFLEEMPSRGGFHVAELVAGAVVAGARGGTQGQDEPGGIVAAQVFAPYAPGMAAHDHVAEMGTWVRGGWRRRGLGRSLWEHTRAAAGLRGFTKIFTDLRADNVESLAYHLAMGFRVAGVAGGHAVMAGRSYDVLMIERFL